MGIGWKILVGAAAIFGAGKLINSGKDEEKKKDTSPAKKNIQSVLFLGDSNTAIEFSYANQFAGAFPKMRVKNISKFSMKTSWMLKQITEHLKTAKYDVIVVFGGSNDIYAEGTITNAKANLDKIYTLAKSTGATVVAIAPASHDFYTKRTPAKLKLQDQLAEWISKNPNKDYFINFKTLTGKKEYFEKSDGYLHAQKPAHEQLLNKLISVLPL